MKQRTRVRKGRKTATKRPAARMKTIAKIRAAAEESRGRSRGWTAEMGEFYRPIKRPVTLRLDADVVAWFKADGRGYQTRINRALRKVMLEERKAGE
jgi:uncharacterized protein (DUF4415 family)